jgi:hypothetical protein
MGSDGVAAEGIGSMNELILWAMRDADPWMLLLLAMAAGPGGINPPYRLDPLQNIINISWGGEGLAVEFHDKAE